MVLGVDVGLQVEQGVGVLHVDPQALGHGRKRLEQSRIDPCQSVHQRIGLVADVVIDGPVVGVDDDLDGVPDVVDPGLVGIGLRVGVELAGGVGVQDPVEAAVGADDVGIVVIGEERRDLAGAGHDVPVDVDPGVGVDIGGDQDLEAPLLHGEEQPVERGQPDAAVAVVDAVDVGFSAGIVKFGLAGIGDHVASGGFPVIDLRPFDLDLRDLGHRRDAVDEHVRLAAGGHLVDPGKGDAVAVGVLEVPDQPGVLDEGLVDLPCREEALGVLAVDVVAVHVHVVEIVVGPDGLGLVVELLGRVEIVDADVGEGLHVVQHVGHADLPLGGEVLDLYVLKVVGQAGVFDVVLKVSALFGELVGGYDQALDAGGGEASQKGDDHHQSGQHKGEPDAPLFDGEDEHDRRAQGQGDQNIVDGQGDLDVGVAGAVGDSCAAVEQVEPEQVEADGDAHEQEDSQDGDLPRGYVQQGLGLGLELALSTALFNGALPGVGA